VSDVIGNPAIFVVTVPPLPKLLFQGAVGIEARPCQ
jgi:hypothetical protein